MPFVALKLKHTHKTDTHTQSAIKKTKLMLSRSAEGQAVTEHFVLTDTKARERGKDGFRVVDLIKINRARRESVYRERLRETQRYSFNGINRLGISARSVAVSMVTHLSLAK